MNWRWFLLPLPAAFLVTTGQVYVYCALTRARRRILPFEDLLIRWSMMSVILMVLISPLYGDLFEIRMVDYPLVALNALFLPLTLQVAAWIGWKLAFRRHKER